MTLLRAMDPKLRHRRRPDPRPFTKRTIEKIVDGRSVAKIEGKIAVDDVVYPAGSDRAGEIIVEAGQKITKNAAEIDLHLRRQEGRSHGRRPRRR